MCCSFLIVKVANRIFLLQKLPRERYGFDAVLDDE
jgi:hypothetical protein